MTVSISCRGVSETSPGLTEELIEFDAVAARHSFENGRRIVLNPIPAMAARPSSSGIDHSPCGVQFEVSIPNHAAALMVNGAPDAVTIVDPLVESQPGSDEAADAAGEAIAPAATRVAPAMRAAARLNARRVDDSFLRNADIGHPRGHRTR